MGREWWAMGRICKCFRVRGKEGKYIFLAVVTGIWRRFQLDDARLGGGFGALISWWSPLEAGVQRRERVEA
jgi:hypothetical protein